MTKLPHMLHVRKFCHFEGAARRLFWRRAECTRTLCALTMQPIKDISERLFFFLNFPV